MSDDMKKLFAVLSSLILIISAFAGCGCVSDSPRAESSSSAVKSASENTSVKKDSEGNIITKDKNGKIISVRNIKGEELDIKDYLKAHPSQNQSSSKASKVEKSTKSTKSKKNSKKSNSLKAKNSSKSSKKKSSSEVIEEEIPTVIATVPDEDEQETIDGF